MSQPDFWARAVALVNEWQRRTGGIMAGREMEELRCALADAYFEGQESARASPSPETRTAATCDRCGGSGPFWIHRDTCVRLCLACTKESDRARMERIPVCPCSACGHSHSADSDGGPGPCRDPQCDCMTWVAPETRTTEWAGTDKDGGQP